jgi:ornithine cyclodeaminase/alanine dehydrogenase-like protein (mu-crystallin family)
MSEIGATPGRAAFEIAKGPRRVMTLSEADVARLLEPAALLDALEDGFRSLARGELQAPPRPEISLPGKGFSLAMPAWRPGGPIAVKVVNVFDGNLALGLPNHLAMILLFAEDTGETLCVMDGTCITGMRTAASAVLSARLLARADARVATVIGAGVQGREHLRLLPLLGGIERIHVASLHHDDAVRLAAGCPIAVATEDVEAAVRASDIVCLATHSAAPVIDARWVRAGAHVSSVGYHPPVGELPAALLRTGRLFVETLDAFTPVPVGCAELGGFDPAHATTLGAVATGHAEGRRGAREVTVYKAMGIAMEDLVAATVVWQRAVREGGASAMDW